jgi:preprotein translocase subunit SecA
VLFDAGGVPLLIARPRRADVLGQVYRRAAGVAAHLDDGPDYTIDHLRRRAELRPRGRHRVHGLLEQCPEPIFRAHRRAEELVRLALVSRHCYRKGHQYQVVDGRVVIVDEYTGRFLPDRSWEHGLHQSVEAKENLDVTADRETLARMSFQRFFRSYPFLCGMTGTVADAAPELRHVYARKIVEVPTNRPLIRVQMPARFFRSAEAKWAAVVESIGEMQRAGRPVRVGTRSIEASEQVSKRLEARGLAHKVLNANFDKEEAELIAGAGRAGTITVATNMAGRGTDIKLDDDARAAGGLHIVLTEMHTAKRIDRQFIGRAGRQGDPGSAQVFVSLEDELVRHNAPRLAAWVRASRRDEELPWSRRLAGLFRLAQRSAEARARRNRAAVLRQDDWIEKNLPG